MIVDVRVRRAKCQFRQFHIIPNVFRCASKLCFSQAYIIDLEIRKKTYASSSIYGYDIFLKLHDKMAIRYFKVTDM